MPVYSTEGSVGADLCAAIDEPITLRMGEVVLVPTGWKMELPVGFEAQVRPRSGLAMKHGVMVVNSPGTIDWDYRGEIRVLLTCIKTEPCILKRGDRIAQMVIAPVVRGGFEEAPALTETARAEGGFGHTGLSKPGSKS